MLLVKAPFTQSFTLDPRQSKEPIPLFLGGMSAYHALVGGVDSHFRSTSSGTHPMIGLTHYIAKTVWRFIVVKTCKTTQAQRKPLTVKPTSRTFLSFQSTGEAQPPKREHSLQTFPPPRLFPRIHTSKYGPTAYVVVFGWFLVVTGHISSFPHLGRLR